MVRDRDRSLATAQLGLMGRSLEAWAVVYVSSAAELRHALNRATYGTWVVMAAGVYEPIEDLFIPSGTILDGGGAIIRGGGLRIRDAHDVVVSNLLITDAAGDGVEIDDSTRVWLNKLTIERWGDGAIDIVRASSGLGPLRVLITKCTIRDGDKAMLIGASDDNPNDSRWIVTLDGVKFANVGIRTPTVRFARVIMRRVEISNWGSRGTGKVAINARRRARLELDGVVFDPRHGGLERISNDGTAEISATNIYERISL